MRGALLSDNDRKEQLSLAYMHALAAFCGYSWSTPSLDRDSVDIEVRSRTSRFAGVAFQLKATSSPDWSAEGLKFQLKAKNHNELVPAAVQTPRLLAVMVLPEDEDDWLRVDNRELVMRRCVWWLSLRGRTPTEQGSVQVTIPKANSLQPDALRDLIRRSQEGDL
jgi:hypothetical protein